MFKQLKAALFYTPKFGKPFFEPLTRKLLPYLMGIALCAALYTMLTLAWFGANARADTLPAFSVKEPHGWSEVKDNAPSAAAEGAVFTRFRGYSSWSG